MTVEIDRDKVFDLLCYGMVQGTRLAESENPYKIGQHTEAMRRTVLRIVRCFPEDFQEELRDAVANQTNEGTNKP